MSITPRLSLITLGVEDVKASTRFYEALGWPKSSASVPGKVSFFQTQGAALAVWDMEELAADALQHAGDPATFRLTALAINLGSEGEVDAAFATVQEAGGSVVKPPQSTSWGGYSGYFADLDDHLWEVAYNPHWPFNENGQLELP